MAGACATPAPLRGPDDPWRLHVLAHPHGPRVLQTRIVAPDKLPVAVLAVTEGGGVGSQRAWCETVAPAPWLIDGRDPSDFRDHLPDGPWVIMALLPALARHGEADLAVANHETHLTCTRFPAQPRRSCSLSPLHWSGLLATWMLTSRSRRLDAT